MPMVEQFANRQFWRLISSISHQHRALDALSGVEMGKDGAICPVLSHMKDAVLLRRSLFVHRDRDREEHRDQQHRPLKRPECFPSIGLPEKHMPQCSDHFRERSILRETPHPCWHRLDRHGGATGGEEHSVRGSQQAAIIPKTQDARRKPQARHSLLAAQPVQQRALTVWVRHWAPPLPPRDRETAAPLPNRSAQNDDHSIRGASQDRYRSLPRSPRPDQLPAPPGKARPTQRDEVFAFEHPSPLRGASFSSCAPSRSIRHRAPRETIPWCSDRKPDGVDDQLMRSGWPRHRKPSGRRPAAGCDQSDRLAPLFAIGRTICITLIPVQYRRLRGALP